MSWLTIKEWQIKSHILQKDLISMSYDERENAVKEILNIFKHRLTSMLNEPEEQKQLVDEVMDKVWNLAQEFGKNRKQ